MTDDLQNQLDRVTTLAQAANIVPHLNQAWIDRWNSLAELTFIQVHDEKFEQFLSVQIEIES